MVGGEGGLEATNHCQTTVPVPAGLCLPDPYICYVRYLLETGLHQVFGEQVPDQVQKSIQTGDFLVSSRHRGGFLEFWVAGVDRQDQNDAQYGRHHSGGHVINHGASAHAPAGFGIEAGQTCSQNTSQEVKGSRNGERPPCLNPSSMEVRKRWTDQTGSHKENNS